MIIKTTKRIVIAVVGGSVVIVGIVMLVAPGPGTIVIPAGLAILGTEFAWARWVLKRMKEKATSVMNTVRGNSQQPISERPTGVKEFHEKM